MNQLKPIFLSIFILLNTVVFSQEILKDGFTRIFYPDGQVSSEGYIKEGKPDGYWKTYYVTGIIKSEGLRISFQLDSTWTFYNQSGEITEKIDYKYGKKNGYTYKYSYEKFSSPVIISKELYVNDKKEGKSFYYFDDGKLKEEVFYVNGKKQGSGREYDERGNVITLTEYHNNYLISRQRINRYDNQGNKQDTWIYFFPSGKVYREMRYLNDNLNGLYKEFNESGNLILSLKYKDGKIVEDEDQLALQEEIDFRNEVNDKGILVSSGSYKKDKPIGIHRFYDEQGKVIDGKIYDDSSNILAEGLIDETGGKDGDWQDFYPSGELRAKGLYRNNVQSGKWTFYYKNGKKEQEGSYLRGLYDGQWVWYHENGNLWRDESYFNGREDGVCIEFDDTGNIITRGEFINGEKEGIWFYKVNDHTEEGSFQTGLRSGIWKYYYQDGVLQFEGEFVQGMPEGKHKFYYPDGLLSEERYYINGVREKNWKKYNEQGNVAMTITYKNDQEYRINGIKINLPKGSVQTIK